MKPLVILQSSPCRWLITTLMMLALTPGAHALTTTDFNLVSGNGSIGGTDSEVTRLNGNASTGFTSAFTAADFTAAESGPAARVINNHPAWISSLPSAPTAQWISTTATGNVSGTTTPSALYAIKFTIPNIGAIVSATLDLFWATDNQLGGGPNEGVFFNGVQISGSSTGVFDTNSFKQEHTISRNDIAPLLTIGDNYLFITSNNYGSAGGLIFGADLSVVQDTPVPAPTTLLLLLTGGILTSVARNKRSKNLLKIKVATAA